MAALTDRCSNYYLNKNTKKFVFYMYCFYERADSDMDRIMIYSFK
jgi:hypothetical protein